MIIYKVYTDMGDGCDYMSSLYMNEDAALKDMYARRESGDEAYTEELEVITE